MRLPTGIKVCALFLCKWKWVSECFSTSFRVNAERGNSGVFVHEAVCDPAIGALVSIHSVNLQDKGPRRLVLQDRRALSVLLTLGRRRWQAERDGWEEEKISNVSMDKPRSILHSIETVRECVGSGMLFILKGQSKDYLLVGQKVEHGHRIMSKHRKKVGSLGPLLPSIYFLHLPILFTVGGMMVVGSGVQEPISASMGRGWCAHCSSCALVNMRSVDLLCCDKTTGNGENTSGRAAFVKKYVIIL